MTKKLATLGIILIVLMGVLIVPINNVSAQTCPSGQVFVPTAEDGSGECRDRASDPRTNPPPPAPEGWGIANSIFKVIFQQIGLFLMSLSGLVLMLSGLIFDWIIQLTIIDMAKNIGDPAGVGGSITKSWETLRDIANMFFIFILIWTAFKAMFELSFAGLGDTIKNIIIVALLINFSLFFTKVVIDSSNIVSVGFYKSIINQTYTVGPVTFDKSISAGYMKMLGVHTLFSVDILKDKTITPTNILIMGVMGAMIMLMVSVIFLITGIMFAARFIILIFLMILSPLALVAYIVPAMRDQFSKWWQALINQSFFAPLYFALTWVVFRLGTALIPTLKTVGGGQQGEAFTNIVTNPKSVMAMLINYVLIIGFSIAALVFAKSMASKTPFFGAISGGVGTVTAGGAAWLGRKTVGNFGNWASNQAGLQNTAKNGDNWFERSAARATLYAGRTARDATFDVRNAKVPTSVIGDVIEGTVGKTRFGKALGLDDVKVSSIEVGSKLAGKDFGTPATKGYKEEKEEGRKRVREEESKNASELSLAQAKESILAGAKSGVSTAAMEQALAKLSEKETETLVASNRDLLKSLNFANAISVKQLEAIIKSDQFSEEEKGHIKAARFSQIKTIHNPAALAAFATAEAVPAPARTPAHLAAIKVMEDARNKVKDLSDSELEMMSPEYFDPSRIEGREFIANLKGGQAENIISNKSGKFSSAMRENVKRERIRPLLEALDPAPAVRTPAQSSVIKKAIKGADAKTMISYLKTPSLTPGRPNIGYDPEVLKLYSVKTLERMAGHESMSDSDISNLRAELLAIGPGGTPMADPAVVTWLTTGRGVERFP